jgi:hypothetical protein
VASGQTIGAAVFATIDENPGGSYSDARWSAFTYPGAAITTGNTVYQDSLMGLCVTRGQQDSAQLRRDVRRVTRPAESEIGARRDQRIHLWSIASVASHNVFQSRVQSRDDPRSMPRLRTNLNGVREEER